MAPINTTEAFSFGYYEFGAEDGVRLVDFTNFTPEIISRANRAIVSCTSGVVQVRWDGGDAVGGPQGGIRLVGTPATDVLSNAVIVIDGGYNVANLNFGCEIEAWVTVVLEE